MEKEAGKKPTNTRTTQIAAVFQNPVSKLRNLNIFFEGGYVYGHNSVLLAALVSNLGLDSAKFSRASSGAQKACKWSRKQFAAVAGVAGRQWVARISAAALAGLRVTSSAAKSARRAR